MNSKICTNCGKRIEDLSAKYCPFCGICIEDNIIAESNEKILKSKVHSWKVQVKKGITTFSIIVVVSIIISVFMPMIKSLLNYEKEEVAYNHETEKQIIENNVDIESESKIPETEELSTKIKEESASIKEDTKIEKQVIKQVSLSEMTPVNVNEHYMEAKNNEDSLGNMYPLGNLFELHTYGESIWGQHGYSQSRMAYAEYKLGYEYEKITGTIAVSANTENEKVGARLEILGDNEIIGCYDLNRKTIPINFELDIQNVDMLKINLVYRSDESYGDVYVFLSDVVLTEKLEKKHEISENENMVKLVECKMVNNNEVFIIDDHTRDDLLGNIYAPANLIEMNTYGESIWGNYGYDPDRAAYAEYFLADKYKRLNGIIAASDRTLEEVGGRVVIYGDDNELIHYDMTKKTEPIIVDMDISNITWLRIELQYHDDKSYGDFYVLLSDFVLHS